jgi:excisionase family DNA binding protein
MSLRTQYNDGLLRINEAAQYCGVSPRTVQRWLLRGELPVVKFGKKTVRIPSTAVRAFIARHTRVHSPAIAAPIALPRTEPCAAQRLADIIRLPVKARLR